MMIWVLLAQSVADDPEKMYGSTCSAALTALIYLPQLFQRAVPPYMDDHSNCEIEWTVIASCGRLTPVSTQLKWFQHKQGKKKQKQTISGLRENPKSTNALKHHCS